MQRTQLAFHPGALDSKKKFGSSTQTWTNSAELMCCILCN